MSTTHGWTNWDPSSMTIWEHLPSGVRCHLVLEDQQGQELTPTGWTPMEDFLPDASGNSIAHLLLNVGDSTVEIECGGRGDVAACRIWEVSDDTVQAHWEIEGDNDNWQVKTQEKEVAVAPQGSTLPADVASFLRTQRVVARQETPYGGGLLQTPLEALDAVIAANTFSLPESGEIITLSRHAVEATGEWRLSNWHTFLTALGVAYVDPALAIANVRTALRHLATGGILSAESTAEGAKADIANPPVAAYCIWKIYQLTGDTSLLDEAYPLLLRWHDWWWNFRDGNQNQLLGWRSLEETGMPGHPIYEEVGIDPHTGLLALDDVAMCSLWTLDAFALMRMALTLNDLDQATHLEVEIRGMVDRMNAALWHPDNNIFVSRTWQGNYSNRMSATFLLPLLGRIPIQERLPRMLEEHLPFEFDTPYLIPTVGKNDPAFAEQLPWRGRVSPLLNYLICEGLRHYWADDWAERITLSGLELLQKSWQHDHAVYETYNALTGKGNDLPQDQLSPTGGLLAALGIAMLIDVEPWDGIRFGHLSGESLAISGIAIQGNRYDVICGPNGLSVIRNDAPWLEADQPVILRNVVQVEREISFRLTTKTQETPVCLRFFGYDPKEDVLIRVNGTAHRTTVSSSGIVELRVTGQPAAGTQGSLGSEK